MNQWAIEFYANDRGDELVKDFIRVQDEITKAKLVRIIDLAATYGPNLGMPYSKNMKNGLYELRIMGKTNIRIFYIFMIGKRIILLHGFVKKTQKTPKNEIEIAKKRQKELTKI